MGERKIVALDRDQFVRLDLLLSVIGNALWAINDQLKPIDNAINKQTLEFTKWQSIQNESITAGFALVAEAIAKAQTLPPPQPKPQPFTPFRVEPDSGFIEIGDIQSMQITDSQQFKITFPAPTDKKGFAAKVQDGSVAITVGNDTATVEPNPDDPTNVFSALIKGNRPGADDGSEVTAVTISADADLGDGVETISKALELMVTGGKAANFGEPTVGTVEEQA